MPNPSRRRLGLFALVLMLPCVVLAAVSLRVARQESELAEKRRSDEKRRLLASFRDALAARLETAASEEITDPLAPGERYRNPATAFVGWIAENKVLLPWENDAAARRAQTALSSPEIAACERIESAPRQAENAARCYAALLSARDPVQAAYARLQLGSALSAAGRVAEAQAAWRDAAAPGPALTDQDGVPIALAAAQRLPAADPRVPAALRAVLDSRPWSGPISCELLREIAERLAQPELRAAVAARIGLVTRAQALQEDFERTGIGRLGGWASYADGAWLVGERRGAVFAFASAAISAPLQSRFGVRIAAADAGEPAGEPFSNLRLLAPDPEDASAPRDLQRVLYVSALFLAVAATAFAAWMLWRDVRRELRLADMRAQFVAAVSHELKTPLTAIRMFAETLQMRRSPDPETESEYLETIVAECERLSRLVDGVLLFAKTEQGKKVYRFRPVRLDEVVRRAIRALRYPLDNQGFRLRADIDESIPPVKADADAIEQTVLNLLGNAMKYSGAARDIELSLARTNGHAVIRVADHGIGIAPAVLPHIFDKFFRAPTKENETTPGTGLGLTLVAQIAKAHGGRVEARSELGKGSAFEVWLPLEEKS